jgi:hypothetical protein
LPQPPGPVSVSSRYSNSSLFTSAISFVRPMNELREVGKFPVGFELSEFVTVFPFRFGKQPNPASVKMVHAYIVPRWVGGCQYLLWSVILLSESFSPTDSRRLGVFQNPDYFHNLTADDLLEILI